MSSTETLEEASFIYCNKSYKWPLNKEGELITMPPNQSVPPGFTKHSKIVKKAFLAGAQWQSQRTYTEEEMKALIIKFWEQFPDKWDIESWIEENKKK